MVSRDRHDATSRDMKPFTGIDAAEIGRISNAVDRWGTRFLDRIYTSNEQAYCGLKMQRLAGRFAAKEAISKVLGTGIRYIRWREMEILPELLAGSFCDPPETPPQPARTSKITQSNS